MQTLGGYMLNEQIGAKHLTAYRVIIKSVKYHINGYKSLAERQQTLFLCALERVSEKDKRENGISPNKLI